MNVILTEHAIERAWQRLGWTAGSLHRMVERVVAFGLSEADTGGALRRYLEEHRAPDSVVRTYGEHIFIFRRDTDDLFLVTVWQIPCELRPALRRAFSQATAA